MTNRTFVGALRDAVAMANLLSTQLDREARRLISGELRRAETERRLAVNGGRGERDVDALAAPSRRGRENAYGAAATAADSISHYELSAAVARSWPRRRVVGEEATDDAWDVAMNSPSGTEIVNLDSLDGSMLFDSLTFGHGSTASVYRALGGGGFQLIYTVTVNSSGFALIYLAAGDAVFLGRPPCSVDAFRRITEDDLWPVHTVRHRVVACVAARADQRRRVAPLLAAYRNGSPRQDMDKTVDELTLVTVGGAPAAVGLLIGRLAALVVPNAQTLHDAAPLIALTALGIPAFDVNGDPVGHAELKERFDRLARPQAGFAAYHPIPRLVFARDPALGAQLAAGIFRTDYDGDPQRWTIRVLPEADEPVSSAVRRNARPRHIRSAARRACRQA